MGDQQRLRWGILGTADIARKAVLSISGADNAVLLAVASRDAARARQWAEVNGGKWGIPRAYGSYEELLSDKDIDAVYVPLPTGVRKEWVLRCAAAKKHVLCEKPVAPTLADAEEMVGACRAAGVLFMDGVMFMHHDRLSAVRAVMESWAEKGHPATRMVSSFSFGGGDGLASSGNIRVNSAMEPLGVLGDLGWYNVRMSLWAFRELPKRVMMVTHREVEGGVCFDVTCTLQWDSPRRVSVMDCSFQHVLRQRAEIASLAEKLDIDDFVVPGSTDLVSFQTGGGALTDRAATFYNQYQSHVVPGCNQHVRMLQNFSALARSGDKPGFEEWAKWALDTQRVVDALLRSSRQNSAWVEV